MTALTTLDHCSVLFQSTRLKTTRDHDMEIKQKSNAHNGMIPLCRPSVWIKCPEKLASFYHFSKMDYCDQYLNDMELVGSALDELGTTDQQRKGGRRGRMWGRRRHHDNDDSSFKSKNLHAERRRRQKLGDRLLTLRSLVPIITNASTQSP